MSDLTNNVLATDKPKHSYIAATILNKDLWNKFGVNWMRKAKSENLTGFVIGHDLPEEAEQKTKELGFYIVPLMGGFDDSDFYHILSKNIPKGSHCLFTTPDVSPKGGLNENNDLKCNKGTMPLIEMVSSIANLQFRAATYKLIEEQIEKPNNGLLSPQFILGSWKFWNGFAGFQNYLQEKKYIDRRFAYHELMLNFYMASFPSFVLETDDVHT